MRLLVATITFGITIGGLFLFGTTETPHHFRTTQSGGGQAQKESENTENYAQIIKELSNQQSKTPTPKPLSKSSKTTTKTSTPSATPSFSATPATSLPLASPISSPILTLLPSQIYGGNLGGQATAPTPSPTATTTPTESIQPTVTPTSGHIYYTSSYATAKYYYCDTDDGWKTLSTKYLKSFSSPEELHKIYPTRILHESCK